MADNVWFISEEYGPFQASTNDRHEIGTAAGYMRTLGEYFRGTITRDQANTALNGDNSHRGFVGETVDGNPFELDLNVIDELWADGEFDDISWESAGFQGSST